jgi:hypothetical protein
VNHPSEPKPKPKAKKKQRRRGAPMAKAGTYACEMVPVQARAKKRKAAKKR